MAVLNNKMSITELNYCITSKNASKSSPITLNLFEAERYDAAVVVQQLIGNLVYYSNKGRYEPRIAESWRRVSQTKWIFNLKNGFVCENGEKITANSFKKSLERTIKILAKNGPMPVFNKLIGYEDFLKNDTDLLGIQVENEAIEFSFNEPVKTGLIEMLSYAPFGYICEDNFDSKGQWKDNKKFISSGAYRVKELEIGVKYILEKRADWPIKNEKSPQIVNISHNLSDVQNSKLPGIIDTFTILDPIPDGFIQYSLVPEYLSVILLGNLKTGFFSEIKNRNLLRNTIEKNRTIMPNQWRNLVQGSELFPGGPSLNENTEELSVNTINHPQSPLIIEGKEPNPDTAKWFSWQILKSSLDSLGWSYKFDSNLSNWVSRVNANYDLRISGPSTGGSFEAWNVSANFCSPVGVNFPDPTGQVCKMLSEYELDKLTEIQLVNQFYETIKRDSAIFPISHFGLQWYIGQGIDTESISRLINVIRFDDLLLDN